MQSLRARISRMERQFRRTSVAPCRRQIPSDNTRRTYYATVC